jgi:hypothetical protein
MSYTYRINKGNYATQVYLTLNDTEIFTFQLDYGCDDDTYIDIRYDSKWTNIKIFTDLSNDVKPLFMLCADYIITNIKEYDYPIYKTAVKNLQEFIKN